ncbi:MAG: hypothetical protein LBH12_03450 [Dysgonamonadaceae bacterium]|jgi:hypothetical protein|nr:hypothetical protein [Dysgonamonadaceae bacterium]
MYKFILSKKINSYYRKNSREKRFLNFKDIQSILILFDTANYDAVDLFVKKLKKLNRHVTAYAYKDKSDQYNYSETPYQIITAKEAGDLFDNKVEQIATEIRNQTFDAVFDLTLTRNIPLEYILMHAHAHVKAGLKKSNIPHYDLAIISLPESEDDDSKVKELGKQIIYYLHTIKTKQV